MPLFNKGYVALFNDGFTPANTGEVVMLPMELVKCYGMLTVYESRHGVNLLYPQSIVTVVEHVWNTHSEEEFVRELSSSFLLLEKLLDEEEWGAICREMEFLMDWATDTYFIDMGPYAKERHFKITGKMKPCGTIRKALEIINLSVSRGIDAMLPKILADGLEEVLIKLSVYDRKSFIKELQSNYKKKLQSLTCDSVSSINKKMDLSLCCMTGVEESVFLAA